MGEKGITEPRASAFSAEDLVFRYYEKGKRNILDHVSLSVKAGKITVITGGSGCGKSTLGLVLCGLLPENGGFLESGEIRLFGRDVKELSASERALLFSVMFQNPDLQFCMDTLRREMIFCLENLRTAPEKMDGIIEKTAGFFGMEALFDRKLQTLSGGEKQKGILACLYAMKSRCLFLDEPFANLDPGSAHEILEGLKKVKEDGRTVVAIDHRLDYWLPYADEIVILGEGGRVLATGITKDNISEYRELFLREGVYYPEERKRVSEKPDFNEAEDTVEVNIRALFRQDVKRKRKRPGRDAENVGDSDSVKNAVLRNINLKFKAGSITAILGRSGIGKTTFLMALLGQADFSGEIRILGRPIEEYRPHDLYSKVGIVFQNPANQFITQKVEDEIAESIRIWEPGISEEKCRERACELLESYGLKRYRNYSPFMLSQGQQRRLAVLSVLSGNQKILLLDEPTYGQDRRSMDEMMRHITRKAGEEGLTVIFTTHDENVADMWADRKIYFERD